MVPWLTDFICLSAQLARGEGVLGGDHHAAKIDSQGPSSSGTSGIRKTWTGGSSGWTAGRLSSRAPSPAATVSPGSCCEPDFLPCVTTPLVFPI